MRNVRGNKERVVSLNSREDFSSLNNCLRVWVRWAVGRKSYVYFIFLPPNSNLNYKVQKNAQIPSIQQDENPQTELIYVSISNTQVKK